MNEPTFGSLFTGIGGIDLGLERAGWQCRWQVENNWFCLEVLRKHWPNVRRYGNIKRVETRELEPVNLIAGGFPCQPTSLAGKRRGTEDPRWLWPEMHQIIRDLRPRFILVENPPGLYTKGFGQVLGDLAACGYDAEWDCIPAVAFGAPHIRERLFLVAYTNSCIFSTEQIKSQEERVEITDRICTHAADSEEPRLEGVKRTRSSRTNGCASERDCSPANSNERRRSTQISHVLQGQPHTAGSLTPSPNTDCNRQPRPRLSIFQRRPHEENINFGGGDAWTRLRTETIAEIATNLCGVDDGAPFRVDRFTALGNACIPQAAEWIGRRILETWRP